MMLLRDLRLLALAACAALAACGQTGSPSAAPEELGGRWSVQQIAGASLGQGVRIDIEIDAASGRISGFTGCAPFTASLESFGRAITVSAVAPTNGSCPSPEAAVDEERFLRVLPAVTRYTRNGAALDLTQQGSGESLIRLRAEDAAAS